MSFFNIDGPIFQFLNKMADLCILNLLFLLCCLPVFTIGAATTALYSVTLKMVQNQEGYIVRSFFKAFKENFRQATLLWLPSLLIIFIMIVDIRFFTASPNKTWQPLIIGSFFILIVLAFMLSYAFPLLAKFENSITGTIKNAFLMGLGHFLWTLCILAILIVPGVITAMLPRSLSFVYMLWILFGCSLTALCTSYIFTHKIFKKYLSDSFTA